MSEGVEIKLPTSVITRLDIARAVTELEQVGAGLTTASIQSQVGVETQWQPSTSEQLGALLELNPFDLHDVRQREEFTHSLRQLKEAAPVVHMTFSGPADGESLRELIQWLRESVHPQAVIQVGLQPELVGGVYVRTKNHVHDLSLRARLADHRHLITEQVEALRAE